MIGYILFQSYLCVMMKLVLLFFICHYSASVENDPVCGESFCSQDFCDKFVNCTDCKNFAKKCAYELHGYCPNKFPIPHSPRVLATTSKPNAGLAVFLISFLCVIVATISVYVYKQRRRQMRQLQTQTQRKGYMEKLTTYSCNKTRETNKF